MKSVFMRLFHYLQFRENAPLPVFIHGFVVAEKIRGLADAQYLKFLSVLIDGPYRR